MSRMEGGGKGRGVTWFETIQFPAYSAMIQFGCAFYRPKAVSFDGWLPSRGCRPTEKKRGWKQIGRNSATLLSTSVVQGLVREKPRESTNQQVVPLIRLARFLLFHSFFLYSRSVKRTLDNIYHLSGSFSLDNGTSCAFTCRAFIERHLLNVIFMHIEGTLGSLMERELERVGTSL